MLRPSIRKQILGIAVGLIVLMAITSLLSTIMTRRVAHQLDELSTKYIEAYGNLARMNVRSLEQALAMRQMVIAKMQSPPDEAGFAERRQSYQAKGLEIDQEVQAARRLINAIIDDTSTDSDNARLGRIDDRIENANSDLPPPSRRRARGYCRCSKPAISRQSGQVWPGRTHFATSSTKRVEEIRSDMLAQVRADALR